MKDKWKNALTIWGIIVAGCLMVGYGLYHFDQEAKEGHHLPSDDIVVDYVYGTELRHGFVKPGDIVSYAVVLDFAKCPGMKDFGPITSTDSLMVSHDDDVFVQAFGKKDGNQNEALVWYGWSKGQCRTMDLINNKIYDWCTPGPECANEAPLPDAQWKGHPTLGAYPSNKGYWYDGTNWWKDEGKGPVVDNNNGRCMVGGVEEPCEPENKRNKHTTRWKDLGPNIVQKSTGNCSPNVAGNDNNTVIKCN